MNILWGFGEMALAWAFPQVGVAMQATKHAKTAYKVTKCAAALFTGDFAGAAMEAAGAAPGQIDCLKRCGMGTPVMDPADAQGRGLCLAGCYVWNWIRGYFNK